jgi:6-pyruvoyl-tetrahydropterin synthase
MDHSIARSEVPCRFCFTASHKVATRPDKPKCPQLNGHPIVIRITLSLVSDLRTIGVTG